MTSTTPVKTEGTVLLSHQAVSASTVAVGSSTDVSAKLAAAIDIFFARTTTTAPAVGVTYRIEALAVGSGGVGDWVPIASYTTGIVQCNAGNSIAVTATSSATLTVTSNGTQIAAGESAYVKDGTLANSEWFYGLSSTATTVVAQENFANNHTGNNAFDSAERVSLYVDLSAVSHLRVVADGSQHNQGFDTKVLMNTFDSLSTA